MITIGKMEKEIKETWFDNHVANVSQHGPVMILDWREPGTSSNAVRYVMMDNQLTVSGDLGEAMFHFSKEATVDSLKNLSLRDFMKRLICSSSDRWHFNGEKAKEELDTWLEEELLEYDGEEYADRNEKIKELYQELVANANESYRTEHFEQQVWNIYTNMKEELYESEEFEIIAKFGHVMPMAFIAYLTGIKMAAEQLKEQQLLAG